MLLQRFNQNEHNEEITYRGLGKIEGPNESWKSRGWMQWMLWCLAKTVLHDNAFLSLSMETAGWGHIEDYSCEEIYLIWGYSPAPWAATQSLAGPQNAKTWPAACWSKLLLDISAVKKQEKPWLPQYQRITCSLSIPMFFHLPVSFHTNKFLH